MNPNLTFLPNTCIHACKTLTGSDLNLVVKKSMCLIQIIINEEQDGIEIDNTVTY